MLRLSANLGEKIVGHAQQDGPHIFLVGEIGREGFLFAEGFLRLAGGNERALVNPLGELPEEAGLAAQQKLQQFQRRARDVPDFRQPGQVQSRGGLGSDARQPAIGQRMQKRNLPAGRHGHERRGFVQLAGDLADQFVGGDPLADGDFQRLPDGLADGAGDFDRGFLTAGRKIEVAFVNRGLFHVRREIVAVAEHPAGELLVTLVIAGQHDQLGAELARPGRGHGREDAELARFVGGRRDDAAAFPADGDGFAPQPGVGGLLDRRKKSVRVQMHDGAGHGVILIYSLALRISARNTP